MSRRPVIAIAGLACETSTFTPSRTEAAAFHPDRGAAVVARHPFLQPGTRLGEAASWHGILTGHALPGGMVMGDAFDSLADEIEAGLRALLSEYKSIDGVWLDIHGAMVVEGCDDAEAALAARVRAVVGTNTLISASMDLHGNVSRALAHTCDLLTCYRTAPHVDVRETRERACANLVSLLTGSDHVKRPFKAWVPVPVLLPGEQTSTRDEPAKHIYAAVPSVEAMTGVLDAAVWVGYAWADEPRCQATVVVTGWDRNAISAGAEKLAHLFWNARADFRFVAPTGTYKTCLDMALASPKRPFFVSDSGDNPTAGGSGDVTWGLMQLLARPEFRDPSGPTVIYASVPGPRAVRDAVEAGIGATVTVTAGAEVDNIHAGPVTMTGKVYSIKHGDKNAVVEVVLQVGSVFAILTKLRKPYHLERDFTELGLKPREADIVIVKIGYLEPELYGMAADWMLGLTPGGVDQDLERLGHRRIRRPMWPFDKELEKEPDLKAITIPMSNEPLEAADGMGDS